MLPAFTVLLTVAASWGVLAACGLYHDGIKRKQDKANGKPVGPNLTKLLLAAISAFMAGFLKKKPKDKASNTEAEGGKS